MALQANAEKIIILVEMMLMGQSDLPCFEGGRPLLRDLKYRLFPNGARLQQDDAQRHVDGLIQQSVNNWRTRCYDRAQYCMHFDTHSLCHRVEWTRGCDAVSHVIRMPSSDERPRGIHLHAH